MKISLLLLMVPSMFVHCFQLPPLHKEISYSNIINEIKTGRVERIIVANDLRETTLIEKSSQLETTVSLEPVVTTQLMKYALEKNVQISYKNNFFHFPEWILPTITTIPFFIIGWNVYQRIASSFTDFQKYEFEIDPSSNATFDDWGGSKEVIRECKSIIQHFLSPNPSVKRPKGILLSGPPGTGKTMLARILANHVNASFIAFSASNFVELYVGMGALRVRRLFDYARKKSPCIIFIDEIDAIGQKRRSSSSFGNNEEREQALNQLLYEMDGFKENKDIMVMGATNRKDILDEALLRPGRFDKIISIPLPDPASRRDIIKILLRRKNIQKNIDLDFFIGQTEGFSGADLEQWINEASIYSLENTNIITFEILWDALEKIQVGIKKDIDIRSESTRKRVAIHEAGHSLLCLCFSKYFSFQKVSIQETYSEIGGYTIYNIAPEYSDNPMLTKDLLLRQVQLLLGGRMAESVFYGEEHVSIGAHDDLVKANELCKQMVSQFGMGSKLNNIVSMPDNSISENLLTMMDYDTISILRSAMHDTRRLVQKHKDFIERLAEEMLFDMSLSKKEVETLWSVYKHNE